VPWAGEVEFYCTQLDHLDENWRLRQIGRRYQFFRWIRLLIREMDGHCQGKIFIKIIFIIYYVDASFFYFF
jgi:hypothetical protein